MKSLFFISLFFILFLQAVIENEPNSANWGFFGHKRINRLAVFTLTPAMMPLYKNSIEYITEHAVDPDKRRYAVRDEAVRHFIDLDKWRDDEGHIELPKRYYEALILYGEFIAKDIHPATHLFGQKKIVLKNKERWVEFHQSKTLIEYKRFDSLLYTQVLPVLKFSDDVYVEGKKINSILHSEIADTNVTYQWVDTFSIHGILPYYIPVLYKRLVESFKSKNKRSIIRLSADLGHYIADAHVPLHTTMNYNGQLTNQLGLHAFWESRIPELFADKEYDYFTGKADYIPDISSFIWDVVLTSHKLVDSVLAIEKQISLRIPSDQQYCFDERLGITVRTQCEQYAHAYQEAMKGMVEQRMRQSIKSVGSIWYSAWIDAGQPNLRKLINQKAFPDDLEDQEMNKAFEKNQIIGRPEN